MIFNPKTGAYKGVGGFAAIFNIFQTLGVGKFFGTLPLYYQLCLE